jgi:creatinine amidohydrolase
MTWEEAKRAYEEFDFVALVTGSHEQHATHLPLLTDSIVGEYFARRLVEEARKNGIKIVLLPTLWLGYSEEHRNFPGTITLRAHTLEIILVDIAESLKRHGVKRFLIINAHGGNNPVLQLAADRMERDVEIQTHLLNWSSYGDYPKKFNVEAPSPIRVNHAGGSETALLSFARPDLLRREKMKSPKLRPLKITRSWWGARYWEDFTDTGAGDDPSTATKEYAEEFFEKALANSVYALKKDLESEQKKM